MRDPKAVALFSEIVGKTEAGKILWQPTGAENEFTTPIFGKFTLTLYPYTDVDDDTGMTQGPPSLNLKDENGKVIAEMSYRLEGINRGDLETLAILARRIAFGANEKLDQLLQDLKSTDAEIGGELWRYNIFDDQNRPMKVSNYIYACQEAALEAAEEYKRKRAPKGQDWYSNATCR